jgi:hypothetical protein
MNVQQSNREDTLVSQDAPYFLDAIRNGLVENTNRNGVANQNLDFLTNYVESVTFITNIFTPSRGNRVVIGPSFSNTMSGWTGSNIVALLSTLEPVNADFSYYLTTAAIVRGLSGPAIQQNGRNLATAFRYQMTVEIAPFVNFAPDSTNFMAYEGGDTNQYYLRYYRWLEATPLNFNLFDVQLHFNWPVLPNGTVGPNHQTYRTQIAARAVPNSILIDGERFPVWYFQPLSYTNTITNGTENL